MASCNTWSICSQNRLPIDACIGNKGNSGNGFSSYSYSPSLKKSVELEASFEVKSFCLEFLGRVLCHRNRIVEVKHSD